MHRVHLVRIATQIQMIAFLNTLDQWLEDHPLVSLPWDSPRLLIMIGEFSDNRLAQLSFSPAQLGLKAEGKGHGDVRGYCAHVLRPNQCPKGETADRQSHLDPQLCSELCVP